MKEGMKVLVQPFVTSDGAYYCNVEPALGLRGMSVAAEVYHMLYSRIGKYVEVIKVGFGPNPLGPRLEVTVRLREPVHSDNLEAGAVHGAFDFVNIQTKNTDAFIEVNVSFNSKRSENGVIKSMAEFVCGAVKRALTDMRKTRAKGDATLAGVLKRFADIQAS